MITVKNADAALKEYYLDAFKAQLDANVSPFFSAIEKNADSVSGKDVKLAVVRGNMGGIVSGSEDGDLPDPYKNRYVNLTVPLKNLYGTIEISDKAMRASRESAGAFVNLVNAEMEGLVSSAKENLRRMLFGDGSGLICMVLNKVNSRVYKVDFVRTYLIGMQIDFYTQAGEPIAIDGSVFITDVNVNESTITLNTDINADINRAYIYVHGSKGNELTGLVKLFNSDDIYGVSKGYDSYFMPYSLNSSGPLSLQKLCDMLDYMEEHKDSKINMILCSYKTRKMIASLADDSRRVVNTIDVHTGYGTVTVNNVPVYAEKYCRDNIIYFLNTDDFALYQLCDWEWLEDEDGKILKQIPGKAAYSATLVKYAELICRKPCGQACLTDFDPDYD